MKKHISTFVLLLVVAGLITALVYTGKSLIQKNTEIAVLKQQNEDLTKSVTDLNNRIESLQDEKMNNETADREVEKENIEKESKTLMPSLDVEKITNKIDGAKISENVYANSGVVNVTVDNDAKSLNVVLDSIIAKQVYGYNGQSENHTIAGLSEKIVDVKILNSGKGANTLKVVILTESGKVKYIDIANILDKSYTIKSVDNVENIVRITGISIENSENNDINYGVVAIQADGTATILAF